MIDYKYKMKKRDYNRVESLSKEMWSKDIMFDYFITILYEKPVKDDTIVAVDNRHLKLLLRRKYKKPISFLFTNEKHLKNDQSKWFNSYHRHILMSEVNGVSNSDIGKNHYSIRGDHRDNRDRDLCRPRTIPKTTGRFLSVVH